MGKGPAPALHSYWIVHVVLPLMIGGLIYVLWRPTSLVMFDWFAALGLSGVVESARAVAGPLPEVVPGWILYSAPGGLWSYSAVAFMFGVWGLEGAKPYLWAAVAPALGVAAEIGQLTGSVPGTFEYLDVITYSLGYVFAWGSRELACAAAAVSS